MKPKNSKKAYDERAQRALDLALAIPAATLALPLCLTAAVAIKLDSPGPAIYRAPRCGRAGVIFTLYKLRTMTVGGPSGPSITAREDVRITRVGRLLRLLKVDELPQLLNVIRGDMSLVGPRPEVAHLVANYDSDQRKVLAARPGITCAATIVYRDEEALLLHAPPGEVESYYAQRVLPRKLELDVAYLQERTLGSDLRLVGQTLWLIGQRCWTVPLGARRNRRLEAGSIGSRYVVGEEVVVEEGEVPDGRPQLLCAVNFRLPESDYRLMHGRQSDRVNVIYALPEAPDGLAPEQFRPIPVGEGLSLRHLAGVLALWRILRRERRDLAAVHFFSSLLFLVGPIAARLGGVPCLVTVTGFGRAVNEPGYRLLQLPFWAIFRHTLAYSEAVLFQNRSDLEVAVARFPTYRHKFTYVPSAVEFPAHFRSFRDSSLGVLLVARLSVGKGVGDFLDLATRLNGRGLRFTLVGPHGTRADSIRRGVENAVATGAIDYLGELRGQRLADVFADHHVLLFPSRAEGLPRVMLEAGCSGLCPIAYDIPGTRDLVPTRADYLVPAFDQSALGNALIALEADRDELARRASAYQDFVTANFSPESYVEALEDVLVKVGLA